MPEPLITRQDDGPVAILTLNRPEKRNALSRQLMTDLESQLERVSLDPKVRGVVLTGAGPVFCSGMDLSEATKEIGSAESEQHAVVTLRVYADMIQRLHKLPKATVAAVGGDALAGGAGLMAACDLAVASDRARIGYPEVLRGLVPSIVMYDLSRLVGGRRARLLLLTGEPIAATVACDWGLINVVTKPEDYLAESVRLAKGLVRSGPQAVTAIKRLLDETLGRPESLRGAAAESAAIRVSDEAQEGIRSFLEKRPPRWVESSRELSES